MVPDSMLASLSVAQRRDVWQHLLREPSGLSSTRVYVVPSQSRITGFSSCGRQRSDQLRALGYDGEISAIYVLRSAQGRGFGRMLFEAAVLGLREMDHAGVSLWVLRGNLEARGFYEHLGGEVIGERQDIRDTCVLQEVAYGWR